MNLLVTGAWQGAKDGIEQLKTLGHQVQFLQFEKDELPCSYEWVEGVICNGLFLSHPIERFTHLKYIQLTSAGFDRVDMQYVKKHNIEIHNARGVYSIPMAEFAIFGVLELYKQGKFFQQKSVRIVRKASMRCRLRQCRNRMCKTFLRFRMQNNGRRLVSQRR